MYQASRLCGDFLSIFGAEKLEETAHEKSKNPKELQTHPKGGKMEAVKYYDNQITISSDLH